MLFRNSTHNLQRLVSNHIRFEKSRHLTNTNQVIFCVLSLSVALQQVLRNRRREKMLVEVEVEEEPT